MSVKENKVVKPRASSATTALAQGPRSSIPRKPARLQVDPNDIPDDDKPPQTGSVFNIWYLKWSSGDSSSRTFTKSKFRVNIKKDAGYTRAPENNHTPICLFFARGCCYLGKKCQYLHRLPQGSDYFIPTQDCFGRDKTSENRDDMSGVGSFNKVNRTLYVGGLSPPGTSDVNKVLETQLTNSFSEFGSIEKIRVLHSKGCAFVTYRLESEAQFAKEAMQNQTLNGPEIINIRWANEDPDPKAQRQEKQRLEEAAMKAVQDLLSKAEPTKSHVSVQEADSESESEHQSNSGPQKSIKAREVPAQPQLHQPQLLASGSSADSLFGNSDLSVLRKIREKQLQQKTKDNDGSKHMSTLLGGYSSSEEDEES